MNQKEVDRRASTPNDASSLEDMNCLYGKRGFNWKWGATFFVMTGIPAGVMIAMSYSTDMLLIQMIQSPGAIEASRIPEATALVMSNFWKDVGVASLYPISMGFLAGKGTAKKEGYTRPQLSWTERLLRKAWDKLDKVNTNNELQDVPYMGELIRRSGEEARLGQTFLGGVLRQMPVNPGELVKLSRQNRLARYPFS